MWKFFRRSWRKVDHTAALMVAYSPNLYQTDSFSDYSCRMIPYYTLHPVKCAKSRLVVNTFDHTPVWLHPLLARKLNCDHIKVDFTHSKDSICKNLEFLWFRVITINKRHRRHVAYSVYTLLFFICCVSESTSKSSIHVTPLVTACHLRSDDAYPWWL